MRSLLLSRLLPVLMVAGWICLNVVPAIAEPMDLVPNGSFQADENGDQWPDGWPQPKEARWVEEEGNRFVRLEALEADKTIMLYRELSLPQDAEALELRWRQRVRDLQVGKQAWYDARIMLKFLDAERNELKETPAAPATRKDTTDWGEKSTTFLVPEGAKYLKFMPSLFQVKAGQFDLDDISLRTTDATPLREAARVAAEKRAAKLVADAQKRRTKAAQLLEAEGSLISNGSFETDAKEDNWPDHWPKPKASEWINEEGNHYLRLKSPAPGEMVMLYRAIDIPTGVEALELSWRQRVTGLKVGDSPWFDARIMLELQGVDGQKLSPQPSPGYTQKDTAGWVTKSTKFMVPKDALSVVLMPCLFRAKAGTFELDDLTLKPTDPAPLLAAAKLREAEARLRYVPPEKSDRLKWPAELKVVGNRLHDPQGREVWLQGVNAGGLETLPHDKQVLKSVVVAIDDWKANCVRIPMNETFWYGKSAYQKDNGAEYRATIDQAITLASNRGAYVAIDLHRFRAPTQAHADFWKDFAALYKDHPAVLFDIFNEPHGISWEVWRNGGYVGNKEGVDESAFLTEEEKRKNQGFESVGMQGLLEAVRSTGAKNIVIAGGIFWCNDLTGIVKGYALEDKHGNGVMYSWHTYNWHKGWEEKVLPTAAKHPIFLGEVGADIHKMDFIPAADQEDPYTWVPDMLGFIQKHRLNWTGWCMHPKATPIMIRDWTYAPTPFWGQFAKDALEGKQFEMKKMR